MTKELKDYTENELYDLEFHTVSIKTLMNHTNPFNGCWPELSRPITVEEVKQCIAEDRAELANTPSWIELAFKKDKPSDEEIRDAHVRKIAFFATNESIKPIHLEVGIPELGCYPENLLDDGNHRFAGAIVRGDETIRAKISGTPDSAKDFGLWNPNEYGLELLRRFEEKQKTQAAYEEPKAVDFVKNNRPKTPKIG